MTRHLTDLECMFVILNEKLYGQNCPFMGASFSIRSHAKSASSSSLNSSQLRARATKALAQTRWKYPTIAAQIQEGNKASYRIESWEEVDTWASRALSLVHQGRGWYALMERLTRESSLPSPDFDICRFYLIVPHAESASSELQNFDILIRMHHAFVDGSGVRAILNEFLLRLAVPLFDDEVKWGEETPKLMPGASILGTVEESEGVDFNVKREDGMTDFNKVRKTQDLHVFHTQVNLVTLFAVRRRSPNLQT